MANELNIGVKFGAEGIPQVTKSITDLTNQLKRFQQGLNTATGVDSIARLNRAIDETKTRIKNLQQFTGAAGNELGTKLAAGSNQATFALTNLSRVAQDAPFGFIGIANNISPLIESFQRLKAEAGSNTGALKALGGSLLGPGGLLLGVGLVSTALTLAGQGFFSLSKEVGAFQKALNESNAEAAKEIANLKVLAKVAGDSTIPIEQRKIATQNLQKALKENNVELSQEKILNNEAAAAINTATLAILERAKARAIENRVAELAAKNLQTDTKRENLLKRLSTLQSEYNKDLAEEQARLKNTGEQAIGNIELASEITDIKNTLVELRTETDKANTEIDSLLAKVTAPPTTDGGGDKVTDILKQRIEALKELQSVSGLTQKQQVQLVQLEIQLAERDTKGLTKEELQQKIDGIIEKAFPGQVEFEMKAKLKLNIDEANVEKPDVAKLLGLDQIDQKDLDAAMERIRKMAESAANLQRTLSNVSIAQEQFKALNDSIKSIFENLQVDFIAGLSEGIGNLISGAVEGKDLFQSIFSIIAEGAKQLGKALIAYGIALAGFKLALKSINPLVAIAAGAGLIIAGAALKAAIPKFAGGVQNFSGGLALVGERGPELVNLPRGSDVIPNHMIGGSQVNVTLLPSLKVEGKEMMIMLQRVSDSNRRVGGPTW